MLPILVWNQVWFSRELRKCMIVFQMSKKERNICEFEMDFKKSFMLLSNLGNDEMIS